MAASGLTPVGQAPRIVDEVYDRLRGAILDGSLGAGTKLSVPGLARELDVSRSPVREAVARLVTERLATEQPRRGAIVTGTDLPALIRLYEVREPLEGTAARLAAERADAEVHRQLATVMRDHRAAARDADLEAIIRHDGDFHRLVRGASQNPLLIDWLDQLQSQVQVAMHTTAVAGGPRQAVADHQKILAAIKARDPDRAESEARAHIVRLRERLATAQHVQLS